MFKKMISNLKKWISALTLKKILIISIAALLIISPLIIAIGNIIHQNKRLKDNQFTVTLLDSDYVEIASESNAPETANENSLTRIFFELITSPQNPTTLPEDINEHDFIRANINYNGKLEKIICYFSSVSDEGIYVDASNNVYTIPKELNEAFLLTRYSEMFYEASKNYELVSADKETIIPSSVDWFYKNSTGEYTKAHRNRATTAQNVYNITNTVNIQFAKKPDTQTITVYEGENVVFPNPDKYKDITNVTSESGKDLHVIITAEWFKDDNSDRYGTLSYDFFVHIKNKSVFTPSKTEVSPGDFILLECTNITDISKIEFSCNIPKFTPVFKQHIDNTICLIPIPDIEFDDGKLIFTVTYGASTETFEINIISNSPPTIYEYKTKLFDNDTAPKEAVNSIIDILTEKYSLPSDNVYFQGNFSSPTDNGFTLKEGHNSIVMWGKDLQFFFTTVGNRYTSDSNNTLVQAVNNGVVAEISENDVLGKYVVIDHGCGMRTWYSGLSYVDAKVGDVLLSGEIIGKSSLNSISNEYEFHFFCTVYDSMIDPNFLFE